jgi:ferritin-like metal-binding protein YciE
VTTPDDHLNDWLRDAHAMEEQAESMLSAQASRIENYPELKAKIEQHLTQTQSQRERIQACIERRGASTSGMRDVAGKTTAMMQGLTGAMASDEVVKGILASYAFEHTEIASYKILIAAAERCGDAETARVCQDICREEEETAAALAQLMPQVTSTYLSRDATDADGAKR